MPARCEAKHRRSAYKPGGLARRMSDAGTEKRTREKRRRPSVKFVGAWCWIGGGQGALSQAHKETGVACKPSKPLDDSNEARESTVVRLISELRNRKMEADLTGGGESRGKLGQSGATKRVSSNGRARWMWEPGVGGWQPGDTDSSDLRRCKSPRIRGSLQTRASRRLARRESNSGQLERPKSSQEP